MCGDKARMFEAKEYMFIGYDDIKSMKFFNDKQNSFSKKEIKTLKEEYKQEKKSKKRVKWFEVMNRF